MRNSLLVKYRLNGIGKARFPLTERHTCQLTYSISEISHIFNRQNEAMGYARC